MFFFSVAKCLLSDFLYYFPTFGLTVILKLNHNDWKMVKLTR